MGGAPPRVANAGSLKSHLPGISYVVGDPTQEGPWMGAVPEADWIINLAGASIFTRWTAGHKQEIMGSRLRTTHNLVTALAAGDRRQLFCSTSAVGIYGARGGEELTEDSPTDAGFLGGGGRTRAAGGESAVRPSSPRDP